MKILYRQPDTGSTLADYGVFDCYLKQLQLDADDAIITPKMHCHGEFEIHFITKGSQSYVYEEKEIKLLAGEALLIPPGVLHRAGGHEKGSVKFAVSFRYSAICNLFALPHLERCFHLQMTQQMQSALLFAEYEAEMHGTALSDRLIENRLPELLIAVFREIGLSEMTVQGRGRTVPAALSMAKGYIADNIQMAPTPAETAQYCHISARQLSRIFGKYEGMTLFDYIRRERIEAIKNLLEEETRSLGEISELLGFSNEYYFNSFFKQNYGMSPGAYRKMKIE